MTGNGIHLVLLLGAKIDDQGKPSPTLLRRIKKACEFCKDNNVHYLLLSGGFTNAQNKISEASVMAQCVRASGLKDIEIICEDQAQNTLENIKFSIPIIKRLEVDKVTIISDHLHVKRIKMILRKQAYDADFETVKANEQSLQMRLKMTLYEMLARLWYRYLLSKQ
mgnify:CR=1 FL=1